jgi:hypothetical protein
VTYKNVVLDPKKGKPHSTILPDKLTLEIEKRGQSVAVNIEKL